MIRYALARLLTHCRRARVHWQLAAKVERTDLLLTELFMHVHWSLIQRPSHFHDSLLSNLNLYRRMLSGTRLHLQGRTLEAE